MSARPHILLLFTDQQRFDTIAALGNPLIRTPALDRLVNEGTAFTHCYTPSPVCVAARCSLMTGLPPHLTGCTHNGAMPGNLPSLMERLVAAGYQTHGVGKMHFTPDHTRPWGFQSRDIAEELKETKDDFRTFLDDKGFAHVDEPNGIRSEYYYIPQPSQLPAAVHQTAWVADRSIDFLRRRDREKPFFLMSSFIKPHPPFETPTPWNKLYRATDMAAPFDPAGSEDTLTYWNQVQNRYKYAGEGHQNLFLRTMAAAYYCSISFVDYQISRILAELGTDLENTLVVFTSDHGEYLGDYGCVGKRSMHDVSARVPMIVRWPGHVPAGHRCATPATLLDLLPTFTAAAGQPELTAEGCDLTALANLPAEPRYVFSQLEHGPLGLYMVTDGAWKYVHSAPDGRDWLFDLRDSLRESRDQSGGYPAELQRLRGILLERMSDDATAVENGSWREYDRATFPENDDDGLLYQDPFSLKQRLADPAFAEYWGGIAARSGFVSGEQLVTNFPPGKTTIAAPSNPGEMVRQPSA